MRGAAVFYVVEYLKEERADAGFRSAEADTQLPEVSD